MITNIRREWEKCEKEFCFFKVIDMSCSTHRYDGKKNHYYIKFNYYN